MLSHGLNRQTQQASGDVGFLGTTYYQLYFQTHFGIVGPWQLSPNLSYMPDFLLPRKAPGDTAKTTYLIMGLPLTYQLNSAWDVSGGLALMWYTIKGESGTTTLNNGNGTSTFARPGQISTARTLALTLGGAWNSPAGRFGLDGLIEGFTNSQKRNYSLLLSVSFDLWNWGDGGGSGAPKRSAPAARSKK